MAYNIFCKKCLTKNVFKIENKLIPLNMISWFFSWTGSTLPTAHEAPVMGHGDVLFV